MDFQSRLTLLRIALSYDDSTHLVKICDNEPNLHLLSDKFINESEYENCILCIDTSIVFWGNPTNALLIIFIVFRYIRYNGIIRLAISMRRKREAQPLQVLDFPISVRTDNKKEIRFNAASLYFDFDYSSSSIFPIARLL